MPDEAGETSVEISPEQRKGIERFNKRKAIVQQYLSSRFPEQNIESLLSTIIWSDIADDELNEFASIIIPAGEKVARRFKMDVKTQVPVPSNFDPYDVVTFTQASSLEEARLYDSFASIWKSLMDDVPGHERIERHTDFASLLGTLSGKHVSPRPPKLDLDQQRMIFNKWVGAYKEIYSLPTDYDRNIDMEFKMAVKRVGRDNQDLDSLTNLVNLFRRVRENTDEETLQIFTSCVSRYSLNHRFTDDTIAGFERRLLPAIKRRDPQLSILFRAGNIWGMGRGDFGAGDFLCHAYALKITPSNLNELLTISRDIPTSDLARLEQNRLDALMLAKPFGALRDYIHDHRPGVHNILKEMVHYYETGENKRLLELLSKADYLNFEDRRSAILDLERYDQITTDRATKQPIKTIDILRRLVENTKPVSKTPPQTTDQELNKRTLDDLPHTLDYVNEKLIQLMKNGKIGIEPAYIEALSWLERKAFETLQNLTFEEQMVAYKQDWFISILKFQELTASVNAFSEVEFNTFITKLQKANSHSKAYELISKRTLENVNALAKLYKDQGKEDTGFLWSGNVTHELIGLTDPKTAVTEQGKKLVREKQIRKEKPGYHPGD